MGRSRALPAPAALLPYAEARQRPHVVVDGAPLPSTVLTLSHWPNNRTPAALRRDTSTATAFAYVDTPSLHVAVPGVTSNHFDEDGLFSMYVVAAPGEALRHRDLLIAGSFAGDFGVVRSRDAARLCFAIETLTDPHDSPLPPAVFAATDRVAALYGALLPRLPELLDDLAGCESLWSEQDAHLESSNALLASGAARIEEDRALDLAILRIPEGLASSRARRYLQDEAAVVHPFTINTATPLSRVLRIQGRRYVFEYRYESWVRLASRRVALRVSLDGLVRRLNELDDGGWQADAASDVVPRLHRPDGSPSTLPPADFIAELGDALRNSPVAWDPYDWPG